MAFKALGPDWTDFDEHKVVSVGEFLQSCTIPLIFEDEERSFLHGTACLFKGADYSYLITAKHVVKSCDFDCIGVPENPTYGHSWPLGAYTASFPSDDDLDVAAIRLEAPEFPSRVGANWRSLGPDNLLADGIPVERFIIAGYPTATAETVGVKLHPKPLQLYTTRYRGPVNDGLGPFDFVLNYAREGRDVVGRDVPTPPVEGVSGAAVWAVLPEPSGAIWTPETQLKLAGVQVSYVHSKYVRAKSWNVLRKVFQKIDPDTFALMKDSS